MGIPPISGGSFPTNGPSTGDMVTSELCGRMWTFEHHLSEYTDLQDPGSLSCVEDSLKRFTDYAGRTMQGDFKQFSVGNVEQIFNSARAIVARINALVSREHLPASVQKHVSDMLAQFKSTFPPGEVP